MTNNIELIGKIIEVIAGLLMVVIIPNLSKLISAKVKNEKIQGVAEDIANSASTVVAYLEQTMVQQLKADGKWDLDAQKSVLRTAVSLTVDRLASTTINTIQNEGKVVTDLVTSYIEAEVLKLHNQLDSEVK